MVKVEIHVLKKISFQIEAYLSSIQILQVSPVLIFFTTQRGRFLFISSVILFMSVFLYRSFGIYLF